MPFGRVYSTTGEFMKRLRMQKSQVRLTSEQEQRLAKLYSILDMINPAQPSKKSQTDYENEKTVVLQANAN